MLHLINDLIFHEICAAQICSFSHAKCNYHNVGTQQRIHARKRTTVTTVMQGNSYEAKRWWLAWARVIWLASSEHQPGKAKCTKNMRNKVNWHTRALQASYLSMRKLPYGSNQLDRVTFLKTAISRWSAVAKIQYLRQNPSDKFNESRQAFRAPHMSSTNILGKLCATQIMCTAIMGEVRSDWVMRWPPATILKCLWQRKLSLSWCDGGP